MGGVISEVKDKYIRTKDNIPKEVESTKKSKTRESIESSSGSSTKSSSTTNSTSSSKVGRAI